MKTKTLVPSPTFLTKLYVNTHIAFAAIALAMLPIGLLIWIEAEAKTAVWLSVGGVGFLAVIWAITLFYNRLYYHSLRYEILQDEVVMHVGVLTKSVKHVPFRTITNITVKRDILDRWYFGLGTLDIQTAGASGTEGAEESLKGLADVQALYDLIATELRKFRSGMSPTAADSDSLAQPVGEGKLLAELLAEVQAMRQLLESNG